MEQFVVGALLGLGGTLLLAMSRLAQESPYIGLWFPGYLVLWVSRPMALAATAVTAACALVFAIFFIFVPLHLPVGRLYFWTDAIQSPQFLRFSLGLMAGVFLGLWLRAVYRLDPGEPLPTRSKVELAILGVLFLVGGVGPQIVDGLLGRLSTVKYAGLEMSFQPTGTKPTLESPSNAEAQPGSTKKIEPRPLDPARQAAEMLLVYSTNIIERDRYYLGIIAKDSAKLQLELDAIIPVFRQTLQPLTACLEILGTYAPSAIRSRMLYGRLAYAMRLFLVDDSEHAADIFGKVAWQTGEEFHSYFKTPAGRSQFEQTIKESGQTEQADACARLLAQFCPDKSLATSKLTEAVTCGQRKEENLQSVTRDLLDKLGKNELEVHRRPYFAIAEALVLVAAQDWQSAVQVIQAWIERSAMRSQDDPAAKWFLFRALNIQAFIVELARRSGDGALVRTRDQLQRLENAVTLLASFPMVKASYEAIGEPVELTSAWFGTTLDISSERCRDGASPTAAYQLEPVTVAPYGLRSGLSLLANELALLYYMVAMPNFESYSARAYEIARRLDRKGLGCLQDEEARGLLRAEMLARVVTVEVAILDMRRTMLAPDESVGALRRLLAKLDTAYRLLQNMSEGTQKRTQEKYDEVREEVATLRRTIRASLPR